MDRDLGVEQVGHNAAHNCRLVSDQLAASSWCCLAHPLPFNPAFLAFTSF